MCEAGIRFTNGIYVKFILNPDNGDMNVMVELIDSDGNKIIITGTVAWDE